MTDPVDRIRARLARCTRVGNGWKCQCPAHDDRENSLKLDRGDGDQALLHCHAGCETEAVLAAVDMTLADLYPPKTETVNRNGATPRVIATTRYQLRDGTGGLVAVHVREDRADGSKRVHWERPDGKAGLNGRRVADLPLYGIHELVPDVAVVLFEGEKARDAAEGLGIVALGTVTGASVTPSDAALAPLIGQTVYLWPDNDDPGRQHMDRIAWRLNELGQPGEDIFVIHWPEAPPRGDCADWMSAGGTREGFLALIADAPVWSSSDASEGQEGEESRRSKSHAEILALDLPPRRPLVNGLVEEESGCIIAGPGGIGKTWLAIDLARAIASGTPWLGHFPTNQAPVLIIDEESNERLIQDRLRLLNASQPLDDPPLWFTIGHGLKVDADTTRAIIEEEIHRYQPGLIIFDSLTRVHSANENDASEMSRVFARFSALRNTYGCAIVLIDHLRKKGLINDEAEMLRGSTDKRNWPDSILFASPSENGSFTVSHIKSRYGEALPEFTVQLDIDNIAGTARVTYQGVAPSKQHAKGNDILEAIHAIKRQLGEDDADAQKIAAWLDVSEATISRYVKRLAEQGILRAREVSTAGRPKRVYDVMGGHYA